MRACLRQHLLMLSDALPHPSLVSSLPIAPSRDTSAIISLVLFLTTLGGIGYFADLLASTSQLTIVGGFLGSLLFFFGLTVRYLIDAPQFQV